MSDQLFCQRCGVEISQEERRNSGSVGGYLDGVCSKCLQIVQEQDKIHSKHERHPPAGWQKVFKNLSDYQRVFDDIRICYNFMKPPEQFPCTAYLRISSEMDNYGASFIYFYPDQAYELLKEWLITYEGNK